MNPVGIPCSAAINATIMSERGSSALHQRENRAVFEFIFATRNQRCHFHRGFCFCYVVNGLCLHVLGGIFPNGFDLMQTARFDRCILRRDGDPMERNLFCGIGNTNDISNIAQAGGPLLTGVDVNHFHAAAISS
jgi:hypothetical protein